ncbi:MAG: glycosyltransferase family 4 protein, partial [Muribaculaceae bacterium]|nr:glycosyltransferase family 4 protein [Muribaculaceae bacterium]
MISERLVTNRLAFATVSNSYSGTEALVSHGLSKSKALTITNCFENISAAAEKQSTDEVRIITVGRFVEAKDYETAIRAVALASAKAKNLQLVIVGYGELEDKVREWVKKYGVEQATSIYINPPNIPELLSQADIYLSTSIFEGTSNSIMEALNADLPVVATRVGDNDRLVEDGVNGILCDVGAYENIADAIVKLAENKDLRHAMGRESKKILIRDYSVDSFRDKYEALIAKITG